MKFQRVLSICTGILLVGVSTRAQQTQQSSSGQTGSAASQSSSSQSSQTASQQQTPPPASPQQQSLGDAARKAREQKKNAPQATKTFTNDDIPALRAVGVSTVGSAAPAAAPAPAEDRKKLEEEWRKRFAEARQKLELAKKDLDVMQRELNQLDVQYYPDPNKALQQQYSRSDINEKRDKIEAKKQEIAKLEQAIEDLQDELRKSGGDPGWGN